MKKVLLLSVFSFFLMGALSAQNFGVRGGLNLSNLTGDVEENKMKLGVEVGPMVEFGLTDAIDLNVSALFSLKGAGFDGDLAEDIKMNYLEIPVLAKFNLGDGGLFAEAGPYLGLLLSAKAGDTDVKDAYKSTDFGLRFGLGYDLGTLRLYGHYGLGLSNNWDVEGFDADVKNAVIHLGVAYLFGE